MRSRWGTWYSGKAAYALLTLMLISGLTAQISETRPRIGIPQDWSHHRIRYSSAVLKQHPELVRDPRAAMQLYRESFQQAYAALHNSLASPSIFTSVSIPHRDWSVALGTGRINFDQYPAKWQADPTAAPSCTTDYVVMALNVPGVSGASGQASMVGLNNLYASSSPNPLCAGLQPNFLFSYNTTTLAAAAQSKILTSPVLSIDGKKVAFIETSTVAGNHTSILHILKIPTSGSQVTMTPVVAPPAGAMTSTTLAAFSNQRSSPFLDYASDTIYVGLDDGKVYKITGVFTGTPTVAGAPWPVLTKLNSTLSSPLVDSVTGQLFVGAGNGVLYTFNINSPPAAATAIQVGKNGGLNAGILDTPIFDATGGSLFAITSNASTLTGAAVVQVSETSPFPILASIAIGIGSSGGTTVNLYDGDFDNAYFNNPSTGHMLVCGTGTAVGDTSPYRYLLPFNGSGIIQSATGTQLSTNNNARCGPVTDYFNPNIGGGTDFFFWSVTRNCPGFNNNGCVMSLTNGTTLTSAQEIGGASGILIDNDYVTKPGGSSIYFSTEQNPLNAVKLTQQGLQ